MSNLVIVALPSKDDYIHKISSEKVPHMTLLFLGEDVTKVKNLSMILDFVKHAANTSLMRFDMEVDRRGVLGPNLADVLFFSKTKWSGIETVKEYRSYLLKENNIRTAYDFAKQFPQWDPHITLGYPETPAKPDKRDYPGINYISFDRIAVWFGEYEGIEFPLKRYDMDMEVAMSDITKEIIENPLAHVGVMGMKWGVRGNRVGDVVVSRGLGITTTGSRERSAARGPQTVTIKDKGKKLKPSGGKGFPAHSEAVRARTLGQIAKKSGTKALSNQDLQEYTKRLQLETSLKRLNNEQKGRGKKATNVILQQSGNKVVQELTGGAMKLVKSHFFRTFK